MPGKGDPRSWSWEEMQNQGLYPEHCPVCNRLNFRNGPDYCVHWWGTEYDGQLVAGPYAEEFDNLWLPLVTRYHETEDDNAAARLIVLLRAGGLEELAEAIIAFDQSWWIEKVQHRVYIEPEASLVSGSGWSLYAEQEGWFEGVLAELREATRLAGADSA